MKKLFAEISTGGGNANKYNFKRKVEEKGTYFPFSFFPFPFLSLRPYTENIYRYSWAICGCLYSCVKIEITSKQEWHADNAFRHIAALIQDSRHCCMVYNRTKMSTHMRSSM